MIPITEAANRLGCSREHLMRLARRGEVAGAKVGKQWVFLEENLRALVQVRTPIKIEHLAPVKRGRRRNNIPRI